MSPAKSSGVYRRDHCLISHVRFVSIFSSPLRDSVAVFVAAFQDFLPPNVPEELLMCTPLVLFLKHGKSPRFAAKAFLPVF